MGTPSQHCRPELWGGIECTINRIGNRFRDQLEYSGHYHRPGDFRQLAELGISHLRYPLLWERHEPIEHREIDWSWASRQLSALEDHRITPIVGLIHHGSGPAFTDLLDEAFPKKFARYARSVAERFPSLTNYIPINEPLTTARFSGLYGHWYPHHNNDRSFVAALLNQLKATVYAMREIRSVNPEARFIQTEDLAKTHSSPALRYQADYENLRRWLTFDLLAGHVTSDHAMWPYLRSSGASESDLYFFLSNPCPPDIMGLNYYVTSERFLDIDIHAHPKELHGGNGRHSYVDTEAVRCGEAHGISVLLREAWERYKLPMALTEVHLGCTCDEQIRWFLEVWEACCTLRNEQVDIRAVTAWSLFGSFDWSSLLTRPDMEYESGAFELRLDQLHLTELGRAIADIASTGTYHGDLPDTKGWWHWRTAAELQTL